MDWLKRFMLGRYGRDQLSVALLIFSLILNMAGGLAGMGLLTSLSYIPLVVGIYRMMSRDISKRRLENYKFSMLISPVYSWFSRTHRYYICPGCKTKLRVPKGKGNLVITCPKCKTELRKRT